MIRRPLRGCSAVRRGDDPPSAEGMIRRPLDGVPGASVPRPLIRWVLLLFRSPLADPGFLLLLSPAEKICTGVASGVYPGRENWSLDKVLCAWAGELVKRATSYWDSIRQEWPSRGQIPYVQHKGEVMHPVRTHTQQHPKTPAQLLWPQNRPGIRRTRNIVVEQ